MGAHECQRCGSTEWSDVDYSGCSECRESSDDPGLPLTTGEGNMGGREAEIRRTLRYAQATRGTRSDSWPNGYQEDVAWLLAERDALRAQLDAAREHLREGLSIIHASSDHPERLLEGKPSGLDDAWAALLAARAALGVEGPAG